MLETTASVDFGNLLIAAVLVMLAIAACAGLAFFFKAKFNFATLSRHMNPKARLSIVEKIDVDQKRKLILIKKDEIEHLVLIGGQEDLIIESNNVSRAPNKSESNITAALHQPISAIIEPKAQVSISDNKVVVASNDEPPRQREPIAPSPAAPQTPAPKPTPTYRAPPVEISREDAQKLHYDIQEPVQSDIDEAELTKLISEALEISTADQVKEQTVAKAVSMLNSEDEVSDFFDQARSRIFTKSRTAEAHREDTDDFQAVLRNQKQAAVREKYRARMQSLTRPTPAKAPASTVRKFDPIPETPEERIEKLKALLSSNGRLK